MTNGTSDEYKDDVVTQAEKIARYSGVPKDREAVILQEVVVPSDLGSVVDRLEDNTNKVERLTYAKKPVLTKTWMKICYKTGIKDPFVELGKQKDTLIGKVNILEREKKTYLTEIAKLDKTEINEKRDWVYDSERVLTEKEMRKDDITRELGREQQDLEQLKAEYDGSPIEEKKKIADMVRGCEASMMLRQTELEDLDGQIEKASEKFNEYFDDLETLRSIKAYNMSFVQGIKKMQRDYRYAIKQFDKVIQCNGKGPIDTGRLLVMLGKDLQDYVTEVKVLKEITEDQLDCANEIPNSIEDTRAKMGEQDSKRIQQVKLISENEIARAKERRQKLFSQAV